MIKSWPNGSENKRVYVMERTGLCWSWPQTVSCAGSLPPTDMLHRACTWLPTWAICLRSPASVPDCCLVCAATYLKNLNLKVGDVIAVRRREDGALVSLLAGARSMALLQTHCVALLGRLLSTGKVSHLSRACSMPVVRPECHCPAVSHCPAGWLLSSDDGSLSRIMAPLSSLHVADLLHILCGYCPAELAA